MSKSIANSEPSGNPSEPEIGDGRHADDITVLKSYNDLRQTKLIRAKGSSDSAVNDTHFQHHYERAETLTAIEAVLRQLALAKTCFVIRGRANDNAGEVHRRKWAGEGATLEDVPRKWLMVDIDKPVCDVPDDWRDDPAALIREIVEKALPDEFHGAGVVWQWSSSMGVKTGVTKVHLWFRLDKAIDSKTAKRWLSPWAMYHDQSVLQTGQPHYTATPAFDGLEDPVRERVGIIDGPDVVVPVIEEIDDFPDFTGGYRVVGRGYEYYRDQIGLQDFHMAMRAAVGAFISKNWPAPDIEWLRDYLHQHVLTCDAPGRTQVEREHRAGGHLDKLIEWTMQKQSENAERQKRQMVEFQEAMQASAKTDSKRPSGKDLQRYLFGSLRR
ncbi:MAG: hypothetical protein HN403_10115 [Rhodospirillales bacterium]|nr:hypothetical protein [Rhodospirillales bacterium]